MSEETLHRLLPRYLMGKLDEEKSDRFLGHLRTCEECQAEKAFLEEVRARVERHGEGFLEDHPPADRLVAYVHLDLPEPETARLRDHLSICATCATEVRWISGESVHASPAAPVAATFRRGRSLGWVAAAAAIVLAILLPSLFLRNDRPGTVGLHPQLIAQVERSDGSESIVYLPADGARVSLYFPVDLPKSGFPCRAEIVRDDGEIVHVEIPASRDDLVGGLYVFVYCTQTDCRPGTYTVRIEGSGGQPPETIPFRVAEHRPVTE